VTLDKWMPWNRHGTSNVLYLDGPAKSVLKPDGDGNWMKRQPGYISAQLHQAIGGSNLFLNYAVWESVAHYRRAFTHPDFKRLQEKHPSSAVAAPHLFKRIGVPNLCTGQ
jgi:hypothetical protein